MGSIEIKIFGLVSAKARGGVAIAALTLLVLACLVFRLSG